MAALRYRLALDLGTTSLGWAVVKLNDSNEPSAVVKAGVRIFSDGRNPKDGSSLAVTRRDARAMRRRRDRLLKRKSRMMRTLISHGFFPADESQRKALESLNPYELRAKGLDAALTPEEFARALFHINQRRGFKSNRRADKKDADSGALKSAIRKLHSALVEDNCRTVGEWLNRRQQAGDTVRARYRIRRIQTAEGKARLDKSYDLYIDRALIEQEFDRLWVAQAVFNPAQFNEQARAELKDCLLFQRPLRPAQPGRCTLLPDEPRAPLALPSTQRFRILQEVNHLRVLRVGQPDQPLTRTQRDALVDALERNGRQTFTKIKSVIGVGGIVKFNFEDPKRLELKGNATNAELSKPAHFGKAWFDFSESLQDEIVRQLLAEENEACLVRWLQTHTGVDEARAAAVSSAGLPEGYGSLSAKALARILPALRAEVVPYSTAVQMAGFEHHSQLDASASGEILPHLPYYGIPLRRHVGFAKENPRNDEERYGKIANPTVHIGLNQTRLVVNKLIDKYGHPSEVVVELARDLKQSREERREEQLRQAENQHRNAQHRSQIAAVLQIAEARVKRRDIEKMQLWEELSADPADRRCPYSGVQISAQMLLGNEVEIEHILPFSQTLDDSLANKTVSLRAANRVKGNCTPWQAFGETAKDGFDYTAMLQRAELMPRNKRYRFSPDGYQQWLRDDAGFLARALNDTRYLSRVAREYLSLICPQATRVIPGRMTAMLRRRFGLNDVLGLNGEKNRNDHRHHAVDACVIAVTDQGLLQRFAQASASAREHQLDRLVEEMPLPWPTYREHVARAVGNIWVSHKPDHGHEGGFVDDTAYRPPSHDKAGVWRTRGIGGEKPNTRDPDAPMVAIVDSSQAARHGADANGQPLAYKGYVGGDNYALEITCSKDGKWEGAVITTFDAYRIVRAGGLKELRSQKTGQNGSPLVMRLVAGDSVAVVIEGAKKILRVVKMRAGRNQVTLVALHEANHAERMGAKDRSLIHLQDQSASSLRKLQARIATVSPIGELHHPSFNK